MTYTHKAILTFKHLQSLAAYIATKLQIGDVICLDGDLGSGKTTFARFCINTLLQDQQNIISPTFNIVHIYKANTYTIWHFDLYRIKNASELYHLGIDDALSYGITLIEWPQLLGTIIPQNRKIMLYLDFTEDITQRAVRVESTTYNFSEFFDTLSP